MNKILLLLCLLMVSCHQPDNKRLKYDEFYTSEGGFEKGRLPLIKPYEAVNTETIPNWSVESIDTNDVHIPVSGIKEVRVVDTIILVHSVKTIVDAELAKEGWFVIVPKNHLLKGFKTHQEYLKYINHIGLKKEPGLFEIGSVWHIFDDKGYMDWKELKQ